MDKFPEKEKMNQGAVKRTPTRATRVPRPASGTGSNRSNVIVPSSPTVGDTRVAIGNGGGSNKKTVAIWILTVLIFLLVIAVIIVSVLFLKNNDKLTQLTQENESYQNKIEELEEYKTKAIAELESLVLRRDELIAQVEELSLDTDERINILNARIEEKIIEIAALNESIDRYKDIYAVDVRDQVELVNELTALIEEGAPLHNLKEGIDTSEIKVGDIDENGNEITEKDLYEYPKISVYYEDISTGFRYSYNADDVMFSASVVKAVYIVSLLEDVSAAYKVAEAARENPEDELVFEDEKYDIENQKWVLTDSAKKEGSGVLANMDEGTEFTYLELVKHAIIDSDNTAFYELRRVFGYDSFYSFASELGVTSMRSSFNNLSAQDAGKFLRRIYEFTESGDRFGAILKEYMMSTKFKTLLHYSLSPTKVAHKYGWDVDAYHDAGIVYNDKPYILVIMTDMDEGGDEVNDYIKSIIKKIDKMHRNFYG
ncbi:MAG: serine hydrolase [Clostridia bacterium]|nr:serine hydrolase [Clostridia bacterium]